MTERKAREWALIVDNDTGKVKEVRDIGQGGIRCNDHKVFVQEILPQSETEPFFKPEDFPKTSCPYKAPEQRAELAAMEANDKHSAELARLRAENEKLKEAKVSARILCQRLKKYTENPKHVDWQTAIRNSAEDWLAKHFPERGERK